MQIHRYSDMDDTLTACQLAIHCAVLEAKAGASNATITGPATAQTLAPPTALGNAKVVKRAAPVVRHFTVSFAHESPEYVCYFQI